MYSFSNYLRLVVIKTAEDFLDTDTGLEKLDSICMQLINIGEALKKIGSHSKFNIRYLSFGVQLPWLL